MQKGLIEVYRDRIVPRLGRSACIVSDNDVRFQTAWAAYHKAHNTELRFSSPHHAQSHGMIERLWRTLSKVLQIKLEQDSKDAASMLDWEDHLKMFELAYNQTRHSQTGVAPHELYMGRLLPDALQDLRAGRDSPAVSVDRTTKNTLKNLHQLWAKVNEEVIAHQEELEKKMNANAAMKPPVYKRGDLVKVRRRDRKSSQTLWEGPFYVELVEGNHVKVALGDTKTNNQYNMEAVHPYFTSPRARFPVKDLRPDVVPPRLPPQGTVEGTRSGRNLRKRSGRDRILQDS